MIVTLLKASIIKQKINATNIKKKIIDFLIWLRDVTIKYGAQNEAYMSRSAEK